MTEKNKKFHWLLIFSLIVWVCFALYFSLGYVAILDEKLYHLPASFLFFHNNIFKAIVSSEYRPANTPLPYIILKFITFNSYPDIHLFRLITFVFSFSAFFIFYRIIKPDLQNEKVLFTMLILLFQPYFFKTSFSFYIAGYGLFFALLSIWSFFKIENNIVKYTLSGILSASAILCQQYYLALPVTMLAWSVFNAVQSKKFTELKFLTLYLLPLIIPFLVFYTWGGVTPAIYQSKSVTTLPIQNIINFIPFKNIVSILTITGFYFFPIVIDRFKSLKISTVITAFLPALCFTLFVSPEFSHHQGFNKITGLVYHFINKSDFILPLSGFIIRLILNYSGCLLIIILFKIQNNPFTLFLKILVLTMILLFLGDSYFSERHLIGLEVILLMLFFFLDLNKITYRLWAAAMFCLGIFYSVYWFSFN